MRKLFLTAAVAAIVSSAPAWSEERSSSAADSPCEDVGELSFLCGMGNAEDLVKLPDTDLIIAGGIGDRRGYEARPGLRLIEPEKAEWRHWLPDGEWRTAHNAELFPGCATPPDASVFMAHGIAVRRLSDGQSRLFVVNHAGREGVEVFDIDARGDTPEATWIGCVTPPSELMLNSVVVTPDGDIFATILAKPGRTIDHVLAGEKTGQLITWPRGESEGRLVEGTELSGNNGLEISPEGDKLYAVAFGGKKLVEFDLEGNRLREAKLGDYWPDNVRWDDQGRLIVAGMTTNDVACEDPADPADADPQSPCYKAYVVEAVDPETMQVSVVASGPTSKAFSHVSAALLDDGRLWIGTVGADRLAYRDLD